METKSDIKFVNSVVARGAEQDWIISKLNFKVSEFVEFLNNPEISKIIEGNKGWLRLEVLKSKGDEMKHYCKVNDWIPQGVSSASHSPDRESADDMPF